MPRPDNQTCKCKRLRTIWLWKASSTSPRTSGSKETKKTAGSITNYEKARIPFRQRTVGRILCTHMHNGQLHAILASNEDPDLRLRHLASDVMPQHVGQLCDVISLFRWTNKLRELIGARRWKIYIFCEWTYRNYGVQRAENKIIFRKPSGIVPPRQGRRS